MSNKIVTWVKAHRTETWLGAGGVAVAAVALWRRHAAAAAAGTLPAGSMTIGAYTPSSVGQLDTTSDGTTSDGGDIQDQINQALGGIEDQIAALQTAPTLPSTTSPDADEISQALAGLTTAITATPTTPTAVTTPAAAPRAPVVYTFKPGDTTASVAAKFGLTAAQLLAANSKSGPNFTEVGHRITIPG